MTNLLWLIPLLPFAGAATNAVLGPRAPKALVTAVGVGAPGLALAVSLGALWQYVTAFHPRSIEQAVYAWTAGDLAIDVAFLLDPLSAVMLFVVTFVGFWIHLYSVGYMGHEGGYQRYFVYLNLFMGAMLLLVLGDNLLVMFVGWEGVGLCSYLLIGFYYDQQVPPQAGRKAFIVNRIGDFAFLVGMFALFAEFGTLGYRELFAAIAADPSRLTADHALGLSLASFVALCFFVGAAGKSAQIPLYVWLPDAMAGPTPVSALIHAATMVTAGVYMVVRMNAVYEAAPAIALLVAGVGAATALFAATIAVAQNDVKKVLAYSTVSQLGYMFLAAGLGAYSAAIFHLGTHAFFKALLFLGAGSVIHAMGGEQDMRRMGGLRRWMPATTWTFVIAALAIAGIPGFAGFFSKDEILAAAANQGHWVLWGVGLATAGLTAFYMFRAVYMTFFGSFRGSDQQQRHLHESPPVMTVPLVVLAVGAVLAGYAGVSTVLAFGRDVNWIHRFLEPVVAGRGASAAHGDTAAHEVATHGAELTHGAATHLSPGAEWALIAAAVVVAIAGILVARALYGRGRGVEGGEDVLAGRLGGVYRVLENRYWVDEIYDRLVVRPLAALSRAFFKVVDGWIIDGLLHTSATVAELSGDLGRFTTTGNARNYVLYFFLGIVILLFWVVL